jgi:hypothetical protein
MKYGKVRIHLRTPILAALMFLPWAASGADQLVVFGLTNVSINGAALSTLSEGRGLHVEGLSDLGYKGVSVRLGEADAGLFFSPQLQTSPVDDNFMSAQAIGRVLGLELPVSSVFCRRNGYGTYPTTVDFSAIGSFSKTYQVYCDGALVREETNSNGNVTFYADSVGNLYPRVNPFWRAPDGSVGVLIDFQTSIVLLPGGYAYGNRVFIKAERPLLPVDHVSRVDIYGGGGLTHFDGWAEWLGMFQLPHLALGSAVFTAKDRVLSVSSLGSSGEDGVMVDVDRAATYEMQLKPVALPTNSVVEISARGVPDFYFNGREFLGPVSLQNSNGTAIVSGVFGYDSTNEVRVTVFNDNVLVGYATNLNGVLGTLGGSNWQIRACGALPYQETTPSSIYLTFDSPVEFQPTNGAPLIGNQLRFSWNADGPDSQLFQNFQVLAANVTGFSITNEITSSPPPASLSIARSGERVFVSWPLRTGGDVLVTSPAIQGPYSYTSLPGAQLIGSRWLVDVPMEEQGYFRLSNYCFLYNEYLRTPGGSMD